MSFETEARHHLREVLMAAISRADDGCADWRIAAELLDVGEITWNYQVIPGPSVATFHLIVTATDAEPATGGVVDPPPTDDLSSRLKDRMRLLDGLERPKLEDGGR